MKIPWVPLIVATTLIIVVVFVFNSMDSGRPMVFGQPRLEKVADLDGTETEISVAPDGARQVAVASGDLWLFDVTGGPRQRLTQTADKESFPAWAPDGKRLTFTRGNDTFALSTPTTTSLQEPELFKENATSLSWSATGRLAFVRDRTLWVTDAGGTHERVFLEPDANPEISVRGPRFSPDSQQIAFIKTTLGLQGEVWLIDASDGKARALVVDRWAENPLDVGWIEDGKKLVYLTNRSGGYGLWVVDLAANTIAPLTGMLNGVLPERVGIAAWQDRILLPRYDLDSNIVLSDGTTVAQSSDVEFEPAASPDGTLVAYTVQKENKFEIWTAGSHGEIPTFRVIGTQPRFSANGFELIYTATDILGQIDLRKVDIRDGSSSSVTDAVEVDFEPDWSPDGRTIAFASNQGGPMTLWTMPTVGGKRRSLSTNGYFPRFSPDGRSLSYWSQKVLWAMDLPGGNPRRVQEDLPEPTPSAWIKGLPRTFRDPEVNGGKTIWPGFDVRPDGKVLTAPIEIRESALWAVNLTYVQP